MDKPKVAIVGRQNVGKSTLFNRLSVGRNIAIVDSTPGVTRDRNYIDCNWQGNIFLLIDTGGLAPNEKENIFIINTEKQVNIAIQEADLIIFVVDLKDGITAIDKKIADILRKCGKPVINVVNKIDYKEQNNIYEFSKLGFKDIIAISASHGINIGDLLDKIVMNLNFMESPPECSEPNLIKIAIAGKPNVGKSSLLNYILGEERAIVTEIPGTTRDSVHSYFKYKDHNFMLIDTAGIRKRAKITDSIEYYSVNRTLKSIEEADIVLLLLDSTQEISEQDEKIASVIEQYGKACILVANKWDLFKKTDSDAKDLEGKIYYKMPFLEYAPIVYISALTGLKVPKLLEIIPEIYSLYTNRIKTNELNKAFRSILTEKRPIFSFGGKNKLMYITQVGIKPPNFVIFSKGSGKLHESYIRYIKNKLRTKFIFTGIPIRIKIKKTLADYNEIRSL
ncbi:MAG: ribosome biogenesis GTPase Der [Candidatus Firestonebacteria bacterium]|nr:ribosome biogenesis GTPase Der [Candidatus Firestonebacteria bacterium]